MVLLNPCLILNPAKLRRDSFRLQSPLLPIDLPPPHVYKLTMDKQAVLLGEIILNQEPRIALYAESQISASPERIAVLKDKLATLLDSRFRPSEPEALSLPGLTIEDVAALLHCRCLTVLKMVRQGKLFPSTPKTGKCTSTARKWRRLRTSRLVRNCPG